MRLTVILPLLCSGTLLILLHGSADGQPEMRGRLEVNPPGKFAGLPSSISGLFSHSPGPNGPDALEMEDLAGRIDSFCTRHPELKSLILKEFLIGGAGFAGMNRSHDRFALQWGEIPRLTSFQRDGLILQRTRELLYNPTLPTVQVAQVDILGLLRWLSGLMK